MNACVCGAYVDDVLATTVHLNDCGLRSRSMWIESAEEQASLGLV